MTWTTRLRKDAALHELPPGRTGRRGQPRAKGRPAAIRVRAGFHRRVRAGHRHPVEEDGHHPGGRSHLPVVRRLRLPARQVIVIRDASVAGHDPALVTTDLDASPAQVIERYAARWSIEVTIKDARQVFGAGQARNRAARAVERTIPFQLACQSVATVWYATSPPATCRFWVPVPSGRSPVPD